MRAPATDIGSWSKLASAWTTEFRVPVRVGGEPDELRYALLRYWGQMHSAAVAVRLARLASIQVVDEFDGDALRAVLLFAIGDFDGRVVFEATRRYVQFSDVRSRATDVCVVDALQWAGRGLSLRPEAVFAALLCLRDEGVNAELLMRRSATSCADVRRVLSEMRVRDDALTREFIDGWGESVPDS